MRDFVVVFYTNETEDGLDTTLIEAVSIDEAEEAAEELGLDVHSAFPLDMAHPDLQALYR